jgi:hypothetical protein
MPPRQALPRLKLGDVVLVLALAFGIDWAKETYGQSWRSATVEGTVTERIGQKWKVSFQDGLDLTLPAKDIKFKSRPAAGARGSGGTSGAESAASEQEGSDSPAGGGDDSSAEEFDSSDEEAEEPDGDGDEIPGDNDGEDPETVEGWTEDDRVAMGQRAINNQVGKNQPSYNLPDYTSKELFDYALHCLPDEEITALAALMEKNGQLKYGNGQRSYLNWKVPTLAVLKWFGCWMYMLSFPMEGDRSVYFSPPDFGPTHNLGDFGVTELWFKQMMACFEIPVYSGKKHEKDPFRGVRRWWDGIRDAIKKAMEPGYVLVLDESMFRWLGRHMPGLMVVRRKPTPVGGEVHTLCCGISGAFIYLELWEGKDAMGLKKYCDQHALKSVALTLRMVEEWRGTGRVVVADSWFGSVSCVLALFGIGLYACMNVKTVHKGYPKQQLLDKLGYVKSTGLCDKDRRGEHFGYTQTFSTSAGDCKVTAGALNQKKPLLLVDTSSNLLPADDRVKYWTIINAQGQETKRKTTQKMTLMHEQYHDFYGVVDQGNRDRQGTVSIADVWETQKWEHRHFAEALGFWEVTVFKHLTFFHPRYKRVGKSPPMISHQRFRVLLSYTLLTGGQCLDVANPERPLAGTTAGMCIVVSPGQGKKHQFTQFPKHKKHQCAYCGKGVMAYTFCETCVNEGCACLAFCSFTTGRDCQDKHRRGYPPLHSMHSLPPPKSTGKAPVPRNKRGAPPADLESLRRSQRANFGSPTGSRGVPSTSRQ